MAHHQQDNFLEEHLYIKGLVVRRTKGEIKEIKGNR
jgi:hypothetical protein